MSRIEQTFKNLKQEQRTALVTYIVDGDPDIAVSQEILNALPDAGADIIELGMSFTDPVADGPAIQAATIRALEGGITLSKTLEMVSAFRKQNNETPVVLMGYFNPVYCYGCDKFITDAAAAGVDGLIIVDLPPEEEEELQKPAKEKGIDLIRLITPVTKPDRLEKLLKTASGFLYYISITGITGTASANAEEVGDHIQEIKKQTELPIAVGFGIKTPADAKTFAARANGVVVGSALIREIEQNPADAKNNICARVQALKNVL